MNLLLDTHVFIWWTLEPNQLSSKVYQLIQNRENRLYLSFVSIWEMQIKIQLGKLSLPHPLSEVLERQRQINRLNFLRIDISHIYDLNNLPNLHRDPFDRLLIAQARVEQIPLLSRDSVFDGYPVERIW